MYSNQFTLIAVVAASSSANSLLLRCAPKRGDRVICTIAAECHQQRNHDHQRGDQPIRQHADGIHAGQRVPVQRQHAPADIGNEQRGNPHPRLLDSTNRSHTRHHSA
ncbi:MAG: hypothetical protein ACLTX2_03405 [Bifidobacterium bifidum]